MSPRASILPTFKESNIRVASGLVMLVKSSVNLTFKAINYEVYAYIYIIKYLYKNHSIWK